MRTGHIARLAVSAGALAAAAGAALADDHAQAPLDAVMMRFPDISQSHIVFAYANDLWIVDKTGGTATPLAAPQGAETFPRFSPDGQEIAFVGNYEGGRDLYTIAAPGAPSSGIANRVTYHPFSERLSDWVQNPDGSTSLLFSSAERAGITRAADLYRVSPDGGRPEMLPVPYGSNASISPNGEWLAYTPSDRDFRTWKRYRGGLASNVWLFNLNTMESRQVTTWEGTDTQPMWVPGGDGETLYYLSDRGPDHRLNIWAYDVASDEHTQITTFSDFDVKFPGMGPGDDTPGPNTGEMVFQVGPDLYTLDLADNSLTTVEVTVPGDRQTLRRQTINYNEFIAAGTPSPKGDFVVAEARGDIWVVPADKGGPKRNLTRTDGAAERDPLWSPSGKWIAYVSDETGEYEVYITQADGRGETRQLTDWNNDDNATPMWRFVDAWAPDSDSLVHSDKAGNYYLHNLDSGESELIFTDPWNSRGLAAPGAPGLSISFSHDSNWIATSIGGDNSHGAIHLYDIQNGALHKVTSDFFNAASPVFDRDGEYLYYTSTMSFQPTYSAIDSTFIYQDADRLLAVPLNSDVENPMIPEIDQITWEEDEDDDEAEEGDTDDAADEDADAADDEAQNDVHPLQGVWTVTSEGLQSMGLPGVPDSSTSTWYVNVNDEGEILGYAESQGEERALADVLEFNENTGELMIERTIDFPGGAGSITSTLNATVADGAFEGTWTATGNLMGNPLDGNGTVTGERSDTELSSEQLETIDDINGSAEDSDEPIQIDLEGFEDRAMVLPVPNGNYGNLQINDKNQLLFTASGPGQPPSVKIFNINSPDDGARNVIGPVALYKVTADGKKLLASQSLQSHAMVAAAAGQSFADQIDLSDMTGKINPREEWRQIFRDAWRVQRDFLYVDNMHGVDWDAVYERYASIIDDITTREDLTMLIQEMISEINVGHAYYWGGDVEDQNFRNVGMLGADYELHTMTDDDGNDHTAYRITYIYQGAPWDADARGPLSQPGVDVEVGDYILAVNGTPIDTNDDIHAAFIGTAGDKTEITVSDMPWMIEDDEDDKDNDNDNGNGNGDDEAEDAPSTRHIVVETLGSETGLRYRAWVENNRKYVAEQTGGRVGYIHVPNTGVQGQNELFRQFYGQRDTGALIIDERWNGGGQIPTRFIELLNRPFVAAWARRDGRDWPWPYDAHFGPKAMLINGAAGSGGDMFPWLFDMMDLGPTIGRRTWGGLVGISGNPSLIDGGYTSAPTFGIYEEDGTWAVEGHGVDPDIMVMDDPALMVSTGPEDIQDPQLDRSIEYLMGELQAGNRFRMPTRPEAPDRSGMGITEEDK